MRIKNTLKAHEILGPRIKYPLREVEVRENEVATIAASGIMVKDGEGAIYWIEVVPSADGGTATVHNSEDNSGAVLGGGYSAKAADGKLYPYDPPKKFTHGIYAAITNATVNICYRPWARNLLSRVSVVPLTYKLLVARLTVLQGALKIRNNLLMRLTVAYAEVTRALVTRVTTLRKTSTALICRVTDREFAHWPLYLRVNVV